MDLRVSDVGEDWVGRNSRSGLETAPSKIVRLGCPRCANHVERAGPPAIPSALNGVAFRAFAGVVSWKYNLVQRLPEYGLERRREAI
jgi:hypothetical protein